MHSVKLNWHTPNLEEEIIREARISAPANEANAATAPRLISYLIRNAHWSPFQMANICIEVVTTRDIARQIMRHTSFDGVREMSGVQEFSQRYADPAALGDMVKRQARLQHPTNRQKSVRVSPNSPEAKWWEERQQDVIDHTTTTYGQALGRGVAKEVARVILPEGMTPTRLHLNGTLRTWIHFAAVRRGHGTQDEAILVAEAIWGIVSAVAPRIAAAADLVRLEDNERREGFKAARDALQSILQHSTCSRARDSAQAWVNRFYT